MLDLKRRQFITLIGAAAGCPLAARAQQIGRLPTIGFLGASWASQSGEGQRLVAFLERLHELGWFEGRTLSIEYRWAEGRNERFTEIASEFARLKVDLIVTYSTPAIIAVKQVTSVIPVVFAGAADPVVTGLVASLARPGGNITGVSLQSTDIAGKRLQLLRELVPDLRRVAIMAKVGNPNSMIETSEVHAAGRTLGIDMIALEIRREEDIAAAFDAIKTRADALYVVLDPIMNARRVSINILAVGARLPTMVPFRAFVEAGGLMSYAPNQSHVFRRSADYVDKILRGAKPGDIPVEQPTKFDLVINLTTAKALGLAVPDKLLVAADEVIE
jgi:putative tryptophan/tyrosine transport system substrate-binding protein